MTKELKFLIKIVKQAADIVTDDFIVKSKDENNDLITDFDIKVEELLLDKLKKKYPDFQIISEEFNTDVKETKYYFTIDPIDGTINFAHNLPIWGIQIAMVKDFKTCAAVLYFPKLNEIYYADATGAYKNQILLNLTKIKYPSQPLVDQIYLNDEQAFYDEFTKDIPANLKARTIRKFYCAAACYGWVASGQLGAFVFAKHLPWDYTPGMYIVKQANGAIHTFKHKDTTYMVAAVNNNILNKIVEAIKKTQN